MFNVKIGLHPAIGRNLNQELIWQARVALQVNSF